MFARRNFICSWSGASAEVGLPIGSALATTIAKMFTYRTEFGRIIEGDEQFINYVARQYPQQGERDAHLLAGRQIASAVELVGSIDNSLDTHRQNPYIPQVAKTAIVYAILRSEAASTLSIDRIVRSDTQMNFEKLRTSWFYQFGSMLVEGVPLEDIDRLFSTSASSVSTMTDASNISWSTG